MRSGDTHHRSVAERRRRLAAAGCALWVAAACGGFTAAAKEPQVFPEYQVKAAFLLNFTRYVSWPETAFAKPEEPLMLCILGADPFGGLIDETVAGRRGVGDRPIAVRRPSLPEDAGTCHILFLSRAERQRQAELLSSVNGRAVLTVGESERFLRDGGGINLLIGNDSRVGFEVNLEVTDRAGLKLSSRMLSLADHVLRPPRKAGYPP